jgi:hypothetical protein
MILCVNLLPHLWLNNANNPVACRPKEHHTGLRCCTTWWSTQWIIKKTSYNGLTSFGWVEGNLRLTNSDVYNFSHTLLVLLPSTHIFQVHTWLKEHFATCTSFVYKQFNFSIYITVHLYTSVSAVIISISCVSGHKRLFTTYILSCQLSHHLCGRRLHYPIPVLEILRMRGRKIHLQRRVMMFLLNYLSSSHCKPKLLTGHLCPITSCAPVRLPFTHSASHLLHLYLQRVS